MVPSFLTLALDGGEWSVRCPCPFTSRERGLVPTGQEAGWAPEPVWTLWRRDKSSTPENRSMNIIGEKWLIYCEEIINFNNGLAFKDSGKYNFKERVVYEG
jgi:hypothetical protein